MRLVKFTRHEDIYPGVELPVFIAPGAVSVVRPNIEAEYDKEDLNKPPTIKEVGTLIWTSPDGWPTHVKENLTFVMNALYYSNDGGHIFGSTNEGKNS